MKNGSDQVRCGKMFVTATCELAQRNKSDSLDMLTHRARLGLRFDEERKTFVEPLTIVSIVN